MFAHDVYMVDNSWIKQAKDGIGINGEREDRNSIDASHRIKIITSALS